MVGRIVLRFLVLVRWPGYILNGLYWAGRTCCWIGEFHPLLATTVTAIMTTTLAVVDIAAWDPQGLDPDIWLTLACTGMSLGLSGTLEAGTILLTIQACLPTCRPRLKP